MSSRLPHIYWISLVIVITGIFVFIFLSRSGIPKQANPRPDIAAQGTYPIATDLAVQSFDAYGLASLIEVDDLTIAPRQLMFFNMRSFNEAVLTNAVIKTYINDRADIERSITPLNDQFISLYDNKKNKKQRQNNEFGLISRGVINGVNWEIYRDKALKISLKAKKAYIDKDKTKPRFIQARLESIKAEKFIISKEIIWSAKKKVFMIPGEYFAQTPKGQAKGKGIQVDLDFSVKLL